MKKTISNVIRSTGKVFEKHSPEILTGIGIAGMITTTVMAVRATPKALELIRDKNDLQDEPLTKIEIVKVTWKCYIPSVIAGGASIACLIGANSVNAKRNAALATAYKLSESAFSEYQEKVVETIGEKKEKEVKDKIAKERIEKDPVERHEVIFTDKGDTLCYDVISGRYFRSDVDKIRKIENFLNKRMLDESYISLNDFYYELGLNGTTVGEQIGWNVEDGLIEMDFSAQLSKDDMPCIVVNFKNAPRYDYEKFI